MKQGLSRDDSLAVKGIAVLMLLFHHLYCSTGRFDGYAVSFFPFSEESIVELALLFKNCVSIFAFISGYGLLKSIAAVPPGRRAVFAWNAARLIRLLSGFWFAYAAAFLVTLCLSGLPLETYFGGSRVAGFFYMLNDFFGLAGLFETPTMNSTWWYMSAAVVYVLLVPLIYPVVRKVGYLPVLSVAAALPRLLNSGYPGGKDPYSFLLPFLFGMLFADYDVRPNRAPLPGRLPAPLCAALPPLGRADRPLLLRLAQLRAHRGVGAEPRRAATRLPLLLPLLPDPPARPAAGSAVPRPALNDGLSDAHLHPIHLFAGPHLRLRAFRPKFLRAFRALARARASARRAARALPIRPPDRSADPPHHRAVRGKADLNSTAPAADFAAGAVFGFIRVMPARRNRRPRGCRAGGPFCPAARA